jgi:hypothetical protein
MEHLKKKDATGGLVNSSLATFVVDILSNEASTMYCGAVLGRLQ